MGRAKTEALGRHSEQVGEVFSEGNELSRWLAVGLGGGVGFFLHGFLVCPQTNWVC